MKKTVLIALLLVVLVVPGCVSGVTVEEIVHGVYQAAGSISSYRFEMHMDLDMDVEAGGEAFGGTMAMESAGVVDVENRAMETGMDMDVSVTGQDAYTMSMEMFLIENFVYMGMSVPYLGEESIWFKSEAPPQSWEQMTQLESQVDMLQDAVEIELIGTEKVRGVDCYVVEIIPDTSALWDLVMQQANISGQEMLPPVEEDFFQQVFRDFSVKQWIEKETYYLARAEINAALEITPESVGSPDEEGLAEMNISMGFSLYDYNQTVSIVLPEEAGEAVEAFS